MAPGTPSASSPQPRPSGPERPSEVLTHLRCWPASRLWPAGGQTGGATWPGPRAPPCCPGQAGFPTAGASSARNSGRCWTPPPKAALALGSVETRDFAIIKVASGGQAKQFTTFREAAQQNQRGLEFQPQPRPELSNQTTCLPTPGGARRKPAPGWPASASHGLSRSPSGRRGLGRPSRDGSHSRALYSAPCWAQGRGRFKSPLSRFPAVWSWAHHFTTLGLFCQIEMQRQVLGWL